MSFKPGFWMLGALLGLGVFSPSSAQQVYKCADSRGAVTYSERPCSKRTVSTDPTQVTPKPNRDEADVRRLERQRVMARSMRPRAGESPEQFETRRRRARLMAQDRAECERLEVRMPVEEASMKNPDPAEVSKAEAALKESRKRFGELGC